MIKIGYQGIEGSNAEESAKNMVKQLKISDYKLVPLISSKNVIEKLKEKEIDYGVVAIENSIGGIVEETQKAIENTPLESVFTNILQIHQCLFVKPEIMPKDVTCIASHPQALKQVRYNRLKYFPNVNEKEIEDTALAAKYLAEGKLDKKTAILCRKNTGKMYGLKLIYENMDDDNYNQTKFTMFKYKGE